MTETRYQLIFSGRLQPGTSVEQVRQAVKERFRLNDAQLQWIFSGDAVTVKRDLDQASAERYQRAFVAAGALVELAPAVAPSPAPSPVDADAEAIESMQVLPAGTPIDEQMPTPEALPDTSHLQLAPPEATSLEDCAPPPPAPPQLDLSRLALAPVEETPTEQASAEQAPTDPTQQPL
ncbi:MAG: hypothetical protein C1943_01425 [Halochromatium sp.]|nr:hypothetical protein [Halochromatium sp.]